MPDLSDDRENKIRKSPNKRTTQKGITMGKNKCELRKGFVATRGGCSVTNVGSEMVSFVKSATQDKRRDEGRKTRRRLVCHFLQFLQSDTGDEKNSHLAPDVKKSDGP